MSADPFPVGEGLEIVGCAPWGGNVMARLSNGARLEVPPESPCRPGVGVELTVARGWDPVLGVALVDGHGRALWYVTARRAEWPWP